MMANGMTIKRKVEEYINMPMEMYMKGIGKMIKDRGMENMNLQMEKVNMMVYGKRI